MTAEGLFMPTMTQIMEASKLQNMKVELQTVGPLFRVTGTSLSKGVELGRAEGIIRPWTDGLLLHLDSMRMTRETLKIERKSLFGLGIFIGGVAMRHGFDSGCRRAELLAINDTDLYHKKVIQI